MHVRHMASSVDESQLLVEQLVYPSEDRSVLVSGLQPRGGIQILRTSSWGA